jgi:hypothetical protein
MSPPYEDVGPNTSPIPPFIVTHLSYFSEKLIRTELDFVKKSTTSPTTSPVPTPTEFVKDDLSCEVVQTFLDWSCDVGNFKSASSLFTHGKFWRMGVIQHTGFSVNPAIKVDMKNVYTPVSFSL